MKNSKIVFGLMSLSIGSAFAGPTQTCQDLQIAEGSITELKYYEAGVSEARRFCYFVSRAVSSQQGRSIGLDGSLMGSIEFCAEAKDADLGLLVNELAAAIKDVPNCHSKMGE